MIVDAGPLISVDRKRRTGALLLRAAVDTGKVLRTTEAIVAQVWRSPRQANLAYVLGGVEVIANFGDGRRIGELLAASGSSDAIDAHLAVLASRVNEPLLTADVDDFEGLAHHLSIRVVRWQG